MDNLNVCRICESLRDLDDIFKPGNETALLLQTVANVSVEPNDYLPKKICTECFLDLRKASRFKMKCEKTDRKFRFEYMFSQSIGNPVKRTDIAYAPDKDSICMTNIQAVDENELSSDEEFLDNRFIKVEVTESDSIMEECSDYSQSKPKINQELQRNTINNEEEGNKTPAAQSNTLLVSKDSAELNPDNEGFDAGGPSTTKQTTNGNDMLKKILAETQSLKDLLKSQINKLVFMQMENNQLLKLTLNIDESPMELPCKFPIGTLEELEALESFLETDSNEMVGLVKQLLTPGGIIKKIESIFDGRLLLKFNYDGIHGKRAFKELKNINRMLFRASRHENRTEQDYVQQFKLALRLLKNRQHKRTSLEKKHLSVQNKMN